MKKLISFIIKGITGSDKFEIKVNKDEKFVNFEIHPDEEIIGMIIGKNGRTIRTIRNLVKVKAVLDGKNVNISVATKD